MIEVEAISNEPVPSVCYLVFDREAGDGCVVVDPGSEDASGIIGRIEALGLRPELIALTHEHFDHCWSVNALKARWPEARLACVEDCGKRITNPKKNLSAYFRPDTPYACCAPDLTPVGPVDWRGHEVQFVPAPGHTACSACVVIDGNIFTGDAYLPNFGVMTTLPTGNKRQAAESEQMIKDLISQRGLVAWPGHTERGFIEIG